MIPLSDGIAARRFPVVNVALIVANVAVFQLNRPWLTAWRKHCATAPRLADLMGCSDTVGAERHVGLIAGVVGAVVGVDQHRCCAERGIEWCASGLALFGHTARDYDGSHHQGDEAPRPSLPIGLLPVE
jgi:hypothetical protein